MPEVTVETFRELMRTSLSLAGAMGVEPVAIGDGRATFRLPFRSGYLRPGGTIGGPMMMGLADVAMYAAVLSAANGAEEAVTSTLTMNFLRRPPPGDLIAEARLLRRGRRLAFGEVEIFRDGDPEMVAHATVTYALP
jgi:uncharacterized protein (TIGR00369 family)